MVPAYLLSLLKQQHLKLKEQFGDKYAHHWIVWEPGNWTAPVAANETVQIDPKAAGTHFGRGDALSFALRLSSKAGGEPALKLGRNAANDIVLNDATVSRHHAILREESGGGEWRLESIPAVKALTRVGDADLKTGESVRLRSGQQIRLGEVLLTYYDLKGLVTRLQG